MSIRNVTFSALAAILTTLTGCAGELPSPNGPHAIVGYAVEGAKPVAPRVVPRTDVERAAPASPPMRELMSSRRDAPEPMRKHGER